MKCELCGHPAVAHSQAGIPLCALHDAENEAALARVYGDAPDEDGVVHSGRAYDRDVQCESCHLWYDVTDLDICGECEHCARRSDPQHEGDFEDHAVREAVVTPDEAQALQAWFDLR